MPRSSQSWKASTDVSPCMLAHQMLNTKLESADLAPYTETESQLHMLTFGCPKFPFPYSHKHPQTLSISTVGHPLWTPLSLYFYLKQETDISFFFHLPPTFPQCYLHLLFLMIYPYTPLQDFSSPLLKLLMVLLFTQFGSTLSFQVFNTIIYFFYALKQRKTGVFQYRIRCFPV